MIAISYLILNAAKRKIKTIMNKFYKKENKKVDKYSK